MKTALTIMLLSIAVPVLAQSPVAQPTVAPDVQQLEDQLAQVGCSAERMTAAQTIAQLRKQIADLQKQKDPPPKSGATKH